MRYLQADVQLVTRDADTRAAVETHAPAIRNRLLLLFGQHSAAQIAQRSGKERLQAGVANGTVLASQVDQLQAELLKTDQQLFEAKTGRTAAYKVLSLLTGREIPEGTALQLPAAMREKSDALNRPELRLFKLQSDVLQQQSKLTGTRAMPKVSAFAQGGYGRPGLNMLENKFDFYYLAGLRLNWTLWNWRYNRTERAIIREQEQSLQTQSDAFELNTRVQLQQQSSEITNLVSAIEKDKEIVELKKQK